MMEHDTTADKTSVSDRIESFISYGKPKCDVCYHTDPEERNEKANFWPEKVVHYIRNGSSCAHEFWGISLCEYHDMPQYHPEDATHRVIDEPKFIGDSHRMNSAYEHSVTEIEEL